MFSYRQVYFYLFIICIALLGFAAYLQYVENIQPCLLCMLQRILMFFLAIIFLAASLHQHSQTSRKVYNILGVVFSCIGIVVAARQIWLQNLPPNTQDFCMPGYSYLIQTSSWSTLIKYAIIGTQDCTQAGWSFLGFSMACWALAVFAFFFLVILLKQNKK